MGHIQTTYDSSQGLTTYKVVGKMTTTSFIDCLARCHAGDLSLLNLWDLTEADLSAIATDEIEDLAEYAKHLVESSQGGKTALVFGGSLGFGLGRMFETYLEIAGLPLVINSFRSLEAALQWLHRGDEDDCGG